MKRISAYQATDGKIFNDKKECRDYQRSLDTMTAVHVVCGYGDTAEFVLENAEALRAALDGKLDEATAIVNKARGGE